MDKPAKTDLQLHPIIMKRWSPRSFTPQMVEKEKLQRIFDASRWAPSSSNEQPWRFIIGMKGDPTWDKIMETLVEFNQIWAKLAPVLGITVGKTLSAKRNRPNKVFQYDVGQSIAYATFQATEEGLYMHQMGGFDNKKAAEVFNVPEGFEVLTAFALGYKGQPHVLKEESFQSMERSERERIGLNEMVFTGQFGERPDWID
jgi:nitroreductase